MTPSSRSAVITQTWHQQQRSRLQSHYPRPSVLGGTEMRYRVPWIIMALIFFPVGAHANGYASAPIELCIQCTSDLDRAMAICNEHRKHPPFNPEPLTYQDDWKACYRINDLWQKSDAARKQREAEAKEKADKAFVESIAKKAHP